jgi:hypothetical protein
MRHSEKLNLKIEYLRKYEFIFETPLAHDSGDPGYYLPKKTEGQKSCDTVPISCLYPTTVG